MGKSVRVNLSISEAVDEVLSSYADLTGRSKAAVVMEAVGLQLPAWREWIKARASSDVSTVKGASDAGAN